MSKILQVAKRELGRFRTRFSGRSQPVVLALIVISLIVSYFVAQQGLVIGKGIYTIGISPDGPAIGDMRFNVLSLDREAGQKMLRDGSIDLYMDGETALTRSDDRSQYAAGALRQYLENAETTLLIEQYDINRSFPLRVEVGYLYATATPAPTPTGVASIAPTAAPSNDTGAAVKAQIEELKNGGSTRFKAEFVSENEVLIPSLMTSSVPLAQVVLAFLYIVPVLFMGIFFNSSFMEEKTNRKLNVLMSAPLAPLDIIAGKMLPYISFSLALVIVITLALAGDLLLALAIFLPIILFIFAIYLMVALVYRTFKDQTFFSMAAMTFVIGYLVLPALFTGINDVSYISPLTLAVQMYRGESFSMAQYALSTAPMYLVFGVAMFVGVRIFNEEYLLGFGPLYRKLADAIYLAIDQNHLYVSIGFISLLMIPAVFMVQMIIAILSLMIPVSLPTMVYMAILLVLCVIVEEVAKSVGIATLLENKKVSSTKTLLILAACSAVGFFIGEKVLLYLSLSVVSNIMLLEAIGSAGLLIIPLIAHFIFTSIVCLLTQKMGTKYYPLAIMAGSLVHFLYNFFILAQEMGMV
ncbi:ABC transporter permease [Methanocella paludicola]|nr:ABC transporter permease [Methanocella paludicola]